MRPRFPWGATLLVALAVAAMVGLGVWQLQRLKWKEALIARYTAAQASPSIRQWPDGSDIAPLSYSRVRVVCAAVTGQTAVSGENALHRAGWAHLADCRLAPAGRAAVRMGWSDRPDNAQWSGGAVTGTFLEQRDSSVVIVADPPLAGLQANARPDPRDLPNNHFSYAVQWFLFAATACVIYGIALWKRLKAR